MQGCTGLVQLHRRRFQHSSCACSACLAHAQSLQVLGRISTHYSSILFQWVLS